MSKQMHMRQKQLFAQLSQTVLAKTWLSQEDEEAFAYLQNE